RRWARRPLSRPAPPLSRYDAVSGPRAGPGGRLSRRRGGPARLHARRVGDLRRGLRAGASRRRGRRDRRAGIRRDGGTVGAVATAPGGAPSERAGAASPHARPRGRRYGAGAGGRLNAVQPRSQVRTAPVRLAASSEARKTATLATSSTGWTPVACSLAKASRRDGFSHSTPEAEGACAA